MIAGFLGKGMGLGLGWKAVVLVVTGLAVGGYALKGEENPTLETKENVLAQMVGARVDQPHLLPTQDGTIQVTVSGRDPRDGCTTFEVQHVVGEDPMGNLILGPTEPHKNCKYAPRESANDATPR